MLFCERVVRKYSIVEFRKADSVGRAANDAALLLVIAERINR